MVQVTRRDVVRGGTAALLLGATGLLPRELQALPLGLPLGLQLYSVREQLPKDYEGTLKRVAALGYREVEAAGFYGHTAAEAKAAMQAAGLRCVSGHYPADEVRARLEEIVAFHTTLGAETIVCSSPSFPDAAARAAGPERMSLDDWRRNAEQFNAMGKRVKAAGLRFGYHNHVAEFRKIDGMTPFDELVRSTDPALVTMELDCGWVKVGGGDPVETLRRYAKRISMLHVKDFKAMEAGGSEHTRPQAAELGQGTTDFRALFAAADRSEIKHCFVEQEQFDMPPFESLKVDAEYMKSIPA